MDAARNPTPHELLLDGVVGKETQFPLILVELRSEELLSELNKPKQVITATNMSFAQGPWHLNDYT